MTSTITIAIILAVLFMLYGSVSRSVGKERVVWNAAAGPDSEVTEIVHSMEKPKIVRLSDGRYINSGDYIEIAINGGCMGPRGINDGERWLAEKVSGRNLEKKIKQGDVLLFFVEDKNSYLVREFEGFDADGSLKTLRYVNDLPKKSGRNHRREQLCGIVRYAI